MRPRPLPRPPPVPRPLPSPPITDVFDTLGALLDAEIAEQGGLPGGGTVATKQTASIFFVGPHVAGTLDSMICTMDLYVIAVSTNASVNVVLTRGRTLASFPTGFDATDSLIAFVGNTWLWLGREKFAAGERIYLDSSGAIPSTGYVQIMVEPV